MVVEEQLSAIEGDGVSAIKRILSGEFPPQGSGELVNEPFSVGERLC
jgi:hypothetical protein